jgi:hypothetical protein
VQAGERETANRQFEILGDKIDHRLFANRNEMEVFVMNARNRPLSK